MVSYRQYRTVHGLRWEARWRDQAHSNRSKRGFTRKQDAQKWVSLNVTLPQATGIHYTPTTSYTVRQVWNDLLQERRHVWKPMTVQDYTQCWKLHVNPVIGSMNIDRVSLNTLQKLISSLLPHTGNARTAYSLIHLIWRHGRDMGAVSDLSKVEAISKPKRQPTEHHYLTMSQLISLAKAAEHYHRGLLILTLGLSGVRWGEAAALRVKDIDVGKSIIHVRRNAVYANGRWNVGTPKSGKTRSVPIPRQLATRLGEHIAGMDPDDLVFRSPRTGTFLQSPKSDHTWWTESLKKAGLPYMGVHSLRHTAASLAVASGADIKVIQSMLGHASAAMTLDIYSDLFQGQDRMAADRLGDMFSKAEFAYNLRTKHSANS